tara:strand:+ start:132 stop:488 length:357 start_codon:yes stop_codon:yes gene_type:complete
MIKLEKLAARISEISDEIKELKSNREINLDKCHGSIDEEFKSDPLDEFSNCLHDAYQWVKEDREEYINSSFDEVINMYGCTNCIGAHKAKRKIGLLKQERGRIVGNISNIGKSLKVNK